MRLAKHLAIIASLCTGACFSTQDDKADAVASGDREGCELTLQSNTLGGTCGELILRNTGNSTMSGWEIQFELPVGGKVVNTWNGQFSISGNIVEVKPGKNEDVLAPNQTLTLAYCATGPATNLILTAGLCDTASAKK